MEPSRMKKQFRGFLLVIMVLVFVSGCTRYHNIRKSSKPESAHNRVTILTYNIRIGAGLRRYGRSPYLLKDELKPDLGPVLDAIRSVQPDIVGLQEVLGEDQAAILARSLNMNYVYVPHGWERYGTWWGVALLSKFPIHDSWSQQISDGAGNTRSNLFALIDVRGTTWCLVVMHKDKDQRDGVAFWRTMQALRAIQEPVVLLGDLNIEPSDRRMIILGDRLSDSLELCGNEQTVSGQIDRIGTLTGRHCQAGRKRIDYILLDRNRFTVLNCGLVDKKYCSASDHIGYFATVRLKD